jgi:hypothetical protein
MAAELAPCPATGSFEILVLPRPLATGALVRMLPECSRSDGIMCPVFASRYGSCQASAVIDFAPCLEVVSHLIERIVGGSFTIWNDVSIIW